MLSYQHSYHAGCLADVQKHAALALMLAQLVEKDKPLTYIETHAGRGLYNLQSAESQKTEEAAHGILPLLAAEKFAPNHPYIQAITATQKKHGKNAYCGSPLIAQHFLRPNDRPNDRLFLMDLHPQEYAALIKNTRAKNTICRQKDGYTEALAISPPLIRRGFVLIDPSYEVKAEYEQAANFVLDLHKKWNVATILLWYPILEDARHKKMCEILAQANLPKFWQQEILYPKNSFYRARGTGLVCINTPFGVEHELGLLKNVIGGS
jgi:23S rRNA (adenine2030-N6)-methyltransferase